MANRGDGGGDEAIRHQPATENVNLNIEGNARTSGDRFLTSSAMMSSIDQIDQFNKTFNPKDYSAEQLTAMLAANTAGIESTKQFMSATAMKLGNVSNIADAERAGHIQPLTIHQDV